MKNQNLEEKMLRASENWLSADLRQKKAHIEAFDALNKYSEAKLLYDLQNYGNLKFSIDALEEDLERGYKLALEIKRDKEMLADYQNIREAMEKKCEGIAKDIEKVQKVLTKFANNNIFSKKRKDGEMYRM